VFVTGVNVSVSGTDTTFNAPVGTYSVLDAEGNRSHSFGTFTVSNLDTVSATTGSLVATGNTIDFDLTQLAAVTVSPLLTAGGRAQGMDVHDIVNFHAALSSPDTAYVPAGTYTLDSAGIYIYGTFTVSDQLAITGTTGALVAAGNTINFDLSQLAAVTVSPLFTAGGLPQGHGIGNVVSFHGIGVPDTAYLPAATYFVTDAAGEHTYGSFTVSDQLTISSTTGALVATGNTISFDLSQLAAVTVLPLFTAGGHPEALGIASVVTIRPFGVTDTAYLPAGTYSMVNAEGVNPYGTFTISDQLTIGATTGALVASGNTLNLDPTLLAAVMVLPLFTLGGDPQAADIGEVVTLVSGVADTAYLPPGTFDVRDRDARQYGTFTVSNQLTISATTGGVAATGNTIEVVPCDLNLVQIQVGPGIVSWGVNGVGDGTPPVDTFGVPNGNYTAFAGADSVAFTVGPSGLTVGQLPPDGSIVSLQLVYCTSTTVVSSVNPADFGQPVMLTATVTPMMSVSGTPTGSVDFFDTTTATDLGTVSLAGGSASLTTASLPVGSQTITVSYSGDSTFLASSGTLTQTVNQASTSIAAGATPNPSDFGQPLAITATVTASAPGAGTPTGSVDFFDTTTATDLGSVSLAGGSASLTTATLPVGSQTITLSYSGDGNFLASGSTVAVDIVPSIYVLNPTAGAALGLTGTAGISIPGLVQVDSSSARALAARGNAQVQAGSIQVVGGFLSRTRQPSVQHRSREQLPCPTRWPP
jgi:hypothetical protein